MERTGPCPAFAHASRLLLMASRSSSRLPKRLRKGKLPQTPADVWSAGLGALGDSLGAGRGGFDALLAEGRRVQAHGGKAVRRALALVERAAGLSEPVTDALQRSAEETVERALHAAGLPGRREVDALHVQVRTLSARLAALAGAPVEPVSVAVQADGPAWAVLVGGRPSSAHPTKKAALTAARGAGRANAPSRLVVYRADGTVEETIAYGT